jgi:MFS family permease
MNSAVTTHIMPYFSSIGIARSTSKYIASALPLMTVIGRVGFGWLGDRVDKRAVAALAFVLTCVDILVLGCTTTRQAWVITVFLMVFDIGWGGSVPMLSGLLREYFGTERLAFTNVSCKDQRLCGVPHFMIATEKLKGPAFQFQT